MCKACNKKYNILTGTAYAASKVSLRMWLSAIYLLSSHKKGISSMQLSRDLDVPQKTAWYMLQRIRLTMVDRSTEMLDGIVSSDETFVGGKNRFRHKNKRVAYKKNNERMYHDKTPVMGILQYGGPVRCFVIPDVKKQTLLPLVYANVLPGSTMYTDEWGPYKDLMYDYDHQVVEHGKGQYKNGYACTNNIEGFWSQLKRSIIGIYHWVSPKHLQRYCDEISFRFNHRNITDKERFDIALQRCNDTHITYRQLVN